MDAFLILVTWPDGREGLLFPRPGNVAVAATVEAGEQDFEIARRHLNEYAKRVRGLGTTTIRLIRFERHETLKEFNL
jgi:hypothetical protein